eukprot:COSAG01_NODE_14035_length_1504_cov_1.938078_1_plen_489_part_01
MSTSQSRNEQQQQQEEQQEEEEQEEEQQEGAVTPSKWFEAGARRVWEEGVVPELEKPEPASEATHTDAQPEPEPASSSDDPEPKLPAPPGTEESGPQQLGAGSQWQGHTSRRQRQRAAAGQKSVRAGSGAGAGGVEGRARRRPLGPLAPVHDSPQLVVVPQTIDAAQHTAHVAAARADTDTATATATPRAFAVWSEQGTAEQRPASNGHHQMAVTESTCTQLLPGAASRLETAAAQTPPPGSATVPASAPASDSHTASSSYRTVKECTPPVDGVGDGSPLAAAAAAADHGEGGDGSPALRMLEQLARSMRRRQRQAPCDTDFAELAKRVDFTVWSDLYCSHEESSSCGEQLSRAQLTSRSTDKSAPRPFGSGAREGTHAQAEPAAGRGGAAAGLARCASALGLIADFEDGIGGRRKAVHGTQRRGLAANRLGHRDDDAAHEPEMHTTTTTTRTSGARHAPSPAWKVGGSLGRAATSSRPSGGLLLFGR